MVDVGKTNSADLHTNYSNDANKQLINPQPLKKISIFKNATADKSEHPLNTQESEDSEIGKIYGFFKEHNEDEENVNFEQNLPLQTYKNLEDLKNDPILQDYFQHFVELGKQTTSDDIAKTETEMQQLTKDGNIESTFQAIVDDKLSNGAKILEQKDGEYIKFDDGSEIYIDKSVKHSENRTSATFDTMDQINNLLKSGLNIKNVDTKKHTIVFSDNTKIKLDDNIDLYDIEERAVYQLKKDNGINIKEEKLEETNNGFKKTTVFEDGTTYTCYSQKYNDDIVDQKTLTYKRSAEDGSKSYATIKIDTNTTEEASRNTDIKISYHNKEFMDYLHKEYPTHYEYSDNLWKNPFGPATQIVELPEGGVVVPSYDLNTIKLSESLDENDNSTRITLSASDIEALPEGGMRFKNRTAFYSHPQNDS